MFLVEAPAEPVDALVVVADRHHALGGVGQQVEELRLRVVGVLELVDHDVAGELTDRREPIGVGAQETERAHDRLAVVHEPGVGEPAVVRLVGAGELEVLEPLAPLLRARGVGERVLGERTKSSAADELVLAAVDSLEDLADDPARVASQVVGDQVELADALEQHERPVLLGRPGRGRQQTVVDTLHPRELTRERMERADTQGLVGTAQQGLGARAELFRRLRAERQGEDLAGSAPPSTSHASRWVRTRVLPAPAPATTSSGPPAWVTASRCSSLRPSRTTRRWYAESGHRDAACRRPAADLDPRPPVRSRVVADLRPFRALRYDDAAGDLERLVCPPYDVIDDDERAALARRRARTTRCGSSLPELEYDLVGALIDGWLGAGVLRREQAPGLVAWTQTFTLDDGSAHERRVLLATVGVAAVQARVGSPARAHARRAEGGPPEAPVRRADPDLTGVRALPGRAGRRLGGGRVSRASRKPSSPVATGRATDSGGSTTRPGAPRWRPRWANRWILIADGHHRYETAVRYREERRAAGDGDGPHDVVMMGLTAIEDPGLVVLPTHRLLHEWPDGRGRRVRRPRRSAISTTCGPRSPRRRPTPPRSAS